MPLMMYIWIGCLAKVSGDTRMFGGDGDVRHRRTKTTGID